MERKLERIIERIIELTELSNDEEFDDELDNALIHLYAAQDRLTAIDEEEAEAENEDDDEELDPIERDAADQLIDEILAVLATD